MGSEHLLQVLVRAANGDRTARANLPPDNLLWRVGNAINLLLTRLRRAGQAEYEMQQLREANAQLTQRAYETKMVSQQPIRTSPLHPNQPGGRGINKERV